MNIGGAIKELRKHRGIKQKELAAGAGISINALCSLELNKAFPKRETIEDICKVLSIPSAYLLYFSVDNNDIPEDKRKVFHQLHGTIKKLLLDEL
jgi:XRE family transcriptional regulator, regulator of sulfur utilization